MRCYGLIIPGSETSRFHIYTTPRPNPILRVKPVTRIHIGSWSSSPLFKTMAAINDTVATQMSFYDLLGIPKSGTLPEIKQAYKQLARKYHPDVSPPDRMEEYTQRFIRVQEAYETLSDPRTRALYDRDMARGLHLAFSAKRRYPYQNDEVLCVYICICIF